MALDKQTSNVLFAAWLAEVYPEVFDMLAREVGGEPAPQLSGFVDILSSIGSAIGSGAKAVYSGASGALQALASGAGSAIQTVAGVLGSAQGQQTLSQAISLLSPSNQAAVSTQLSRASAGQAPATIDTAYDPRTQSYVPVYVNPNGQTSAFTPQMAGALSPSFFQQYGIYLVGGAIIITLLLTRRS